MFHHKISSATSMFLFSILVHLLGLTGKPSPISYTYQSLLPKFKKEQKHICSISVTSI